MQNRDLTKKIAAILQMHAGETQYFTLPGLFHMESMDWLMDSMEWLMDSMEWLMDSMEFPDHSMDFPDGFHIIPWNFQMDSILFSQWSPYEIHGIHME